MHLLCRIHRMSRMISCYRMSRTCGVQNFIDVFLAGFSPTSTYMVRIDSLLTGNPILTRLTVESDYTVVFFAAGGKYTPGWNWVWKAYRSLSRKYRKNLKQLVSLLKLMTYLSFQNPFSVYCTLFIFHQKCVIRRGSTQVAY